jgi:hypothetical protein
MGCAIGLGQSQVFLNSLKLRVQGDALIDRPRLTDRRYFPIPFLRPTGIGRAFTTPITTDFNWFHQSSTPLLPKQMRTDFAVRGLQMVWN